MPELSEQQKATARPIADSIRQLNRELQRLNTVLLHMAAMIEPRVLDPASGVQFNIEELTFTYPDPGNACEAET